jgi:hypothetical protein
MTHGSPKGRVEGSRKARPHMPRTVRSSQGGWVGVRNNHTEAWKRSEMARERSDSRDATTGNTTSCNIANTTRPLHVHVAGSRTPLATELNLAERSIIESHTHTRGAKLVPPVPQDEVQGRQDNE